VEEYLTDTLKSPEQTLGKATDSLIEDDKFFDNIATNLASNTAVCERIGIQIKPFDLGK